MATLEKIPKEKATINTLRLLRGNLLLLAVSVAVYLFFSRVYADGFNKKLSFIDALYFAIVTQSTVGYGDIGPASPGMKVAVMVHIALSVFLNVCELIDATAAGWFLELVYEYGYASISLAILLVCSAVAVVQDGADIATRVVIGIIFASLIFALYHYFREKPKSISVSP